MFKQILHSSIWTFAGNGLQQALQFAIFILLARYLEPSVFGYVALAAVVFDVVGVLGRWGIAQLILQRPRPGALFLSHAFIFSISLGLLLTLAVLAGTWLHVALNGQTELSELLWMLAPMVLLQAAGAVPEAVLRRKLNFKWLAVRNNVGALVAGAVAVGLAMAGMGIYALVAQRLLSVATLTALVWVAAGDSVQLFALSRYRARVFEGIGHAGMQLLSGPLAGMLGPRANDMMVGLVFGPLALGQMKMAGRIFEFVVQFTVSPLSSVAEAALPKLVGKPEQLRDVYQKVQGICALATLPLFAGIAATADLWVPLVLGAKWNEAIPLIGWLSLAALPSVVNYFQIPLLIAHRRNALIFKLNMVRLISGLALTAIGSLIGVEAVVLLFVMQAYAFMAFNWFVIRKTAGWPIGESLANIGPALLGTLGMAALLWAGQSHGLWGKGWGGLGLMCLAGVASYVVLLLLLLRGKAVRIVKEAWRVLGQRSL